MGAEMGELSVFVDESGDQDGRSKYYVLTLVFHEQRFDIAKSIEEHRRGLAVRSLADVPFHAGPILNGHDDFCGMSFEKRKLYFTLFFMDVQKLPVTYQTFLYRRSEFSDSLLLSARMRRDIVLFLFDQLGYFQSFDKVKVYYDDGQAIVASALHAALKYALSVESVLYRKADPADFMLAQVADMLCTLELTACKFRNKEATRTDEKMFGSARSFKNNYMKALRRKRLVKSARLLS